MGDLSENFCYAEFFVSRDYPDLAKAAYERERDNEEYFNKFKHWCMLIGQPTRDYIKKPVVVLNGYRDQFLNRAVGGVKDADHCHAMAVDFTAEYDLYQLFKWMIDNLCYRQIIYYPAQNFVHASINWFEKQYKHSALVKEGDKYLQAHDYYIAKG